MKKNKKIRTNSPKYKTVSTIYIFNGDLRNNVLTIL